MPSTLIMYLILIALEGETNPRAPWSSYALAPSAQLAVTLTPTKVSSSMAWTRLSGNPI